MSISVVSLSIRVRAEHGMATYDTRFGDGLNVIIAPNTWGKSSLFQSIVYALGLEGAFTTSRRFPLGPAMTRAVNTSAGRLTVLESFIDLILRNHAGNYMKVRRWGLSLEADTRLVRVWSSQSEGDLLDAEPQDYFVRDSGAAARERGFHHRLEGFVGWELPSVPNYQDGETKLYLKFFCRTSTSSRRQDGRVLVRVYLPTKESVNRFDEQWRSQSRCPLSSGSRRWPPSESDQCSYLETRPWQFQLLLLQRLQKGFGCRFSMARPSASAIVVTPS